jgi:hypothetical protein
MITLKIYSVKRDRFFKWTYWCVATLHDVFGHIFHTIFSV